MPGIISISAPLFKRGGHFVENFLHFFCRWRKNTLARGGFARSGALGLPGHLPIIRPVPARRAAGVRFPCVACGASVSATATSPATGSASGRPYAVPPGSATGCRMSAATPSPRTMPPCSGICRSCSWRWATAIPRFCARVTWYPPGAKMPRASGKVPDCPGAQKHTCKGRMEPRPDKRTA